MNCLIELIGELSSISFAIWPDMLSICIWPDTKILRRASAKNYTLMIKDEIYLHKRLFERNLKCFVRQSQELEMRKQLK